MYAIVCANAYIYIYLFIYLFIFIFIFISIFIFIQTHIHSQIVVLCLHACVFMYVYIEGSLGYLRLRAKSLGCSFWCSFQPRCLAFKSKIGSMGFLSGV